MTISYRLKPADHWRLNLFVMTHDLRSGGPLIVACLLMPCFLLLSMLREGKSLHESATAALTVLVVACIAGYPLLRLLAWYKFRALPVHLLTIEMTCQESGIRVKTPQGSQNVKWSALAQVRSDRQATYLFLSRRVALIVPLRAFSTQEDRVSFLDLVRQHTGGR